MNYFLIVLYCLVGLLAIFLLVSIVFSIYLYRYVFYPKKYSTQKTIEVESEKGFLGDYIGLNETYDTLKKEELDFTMKDGYIIHGTFIEKNNKKIVIITHGYTYTRYGSVKYMWLFRKLGYSVYLYDIRNHGENKNTICTMGYKETNDLDEIIKQIYLKFGNDIEVGIHGESLGSAISSLSLKNNQSLSFAVIDCGFANLYTYFVEFAKWRKIPIYLLRIANLYCLMFNGFQLKDVSPLDVFKENKVPILFMNGDADKYIPKHNSEDMYKVDKGYKEIHFFAHSGHAHSLEEHKEEYFKILDSFLNNIEGEKYGK